MILPHNNVSNIHDFSPATSIPRLDGRVIIVAGASAGIGKQTVLELSRHNPQRIYLTARSRAKYEAALGDIVSANPSAKNCIEYLELDLASMKSVQAAASQILAKESRLDILINNGGVMGVPAELTSDGGYEIHFGTNYMGPAALTKLLMPLMLKTAQLPDTPKNSVRVVHVSSAAASSGLVPFGKLDWNTMKTKREDIIEFRRYAISKLAQVLYAHESAERWPEVVHVAIHPGRVDTTLLDGYMATGKRWSLMGMFQRAFDATAGMLTVEQGAWTQLWAATWGGGGLENGRFYFPVGVLNEGDSRSKDVKLRKELWDWTEAELKKYGI